jgi:predicted metal-binding membrane protein
MTMRSLGVGSGLVAVSLLAWAVVVQQTRGMAMGPSGDLDGLTWYLGLWVAMTAAMMLPSAAPAVLLVDRLSPRATPRFLLGYVVAWTVYGAAAYLVTRAAHDAGLAGGRATGPLIAAAGVYGLTPLKRTCLRRCRNPLGFLMRHERHGPLATGVLHGGYCVGCCAGLMVLLLAVGMMNVFWMVVVAAVIAAEKTAPRGERLVTPIGVAIVCTGVWVAFA